ncbi:MAG: efflux RND transporter periplasmic adaptor subunit, partial [Pseudomonadota bacterium]
MNGLVARIAPIFLIFALVGCEEEIEEAPTKVVRPAKLIEISETTSVRTLRLPAIVGAASTSDLAFQVSGTLQELQIDEGRLVEKGDVLATLNQRDFINDVASARAQFDNAQIEFERAETLVAANAIARSVLDERRSQRDTTRAALDSALKALEDTTIRAPFDGVVADIFVESFENITAQAPILTLQSQGDAEAIVQVPASVVANIENLAPVDIELELDAAPGRLMPAEFSEAASVSDPNTQTFETRFSFSPPAALTVLPGMTGILTGRFETRTEEGQGEVLITLPIDAIVAEAGQPYVWIVDEQSMTVARRDVEVEPGPGGNVVAKSGLKPGDTIVGAGGKYLYEGAETPVVNDQYGDVYGLYYLITGAGFTLKQLEDYALDLRKDILSVDGVAKVSLSGEQTACNASLSGENSNFISTSMMERPSDKEALQAVWSKLRNRVDDAVADLPPGAETPVVNDQYGDVYGLYYLITGAGFTLKQLEDYALDLRKDILSVDGVAKVSLSGEQTACNASLSGENSNFISTSMMERPSDKEALQAVWSKLRNRVDDAVADLPPGAETPVVNDQYGDVYGLYYLITGAG